MKNETQRHLLTAVMIAFVLGFAGAILIDGDDEQGEQDHYCQMVADGLWPEYRKGDITCE